MAQPVVHFEITGRAPAKLRAYYGSLFGWTFDMESPVAPSVSEPGQYGFIEKTALPDGTGIPGGIGGGESFEAHAVFYVFVADVAAALANAERLGGKCVMGPERNPDGTLMVAHFTDPEGNRIGLAGPIVG